MGRPSAREVLLWSGLAYMFTSSVALALYLYTPELYPTRMRALGSSTGSAWSRLASIVGLSSEGLHFSPAETLHDVIVHHPNGLHEGIANGGTDKGKTAPLQLLAHCI